MPPRFGSIDQFLGDDGRDSISLKNFRQQLAADIGGQRRVTGVILLIKMIGQKTKHQAAGHRRWKRRGDDVQIDFAALQFFDDLAQRIQVKDIVQAVTESLDDDGKIRILANDLQ